MTDLETMIEMMTRAGVKFKEIPTVHPDATVHPDGVLLDVEEVPGSETNLGYGGFFSRLYFTPDGRLRAAVRRHRGLGMTDLETIRAMLARTGATFQEERIDSPGQFDYASFPHIQIMWRGANDKNLGQPWCWALMLFSPDGALLHVGATE